jgi:hypothetical protein
MVRRVVRPRHEVVEEVPSPPTLTEQYSSAPGKCLVCHRVVTGHHPVFGEHSMCGVCHRRQLRNLMPAQRGPAVERGLAISLQHKLSAGLALNVATGRYSVEEAKRRMRLIKREQDGLSNDAYSVGGRVPGSFEQGRRK